MLLDRTLRPHIHLLGRVLPSFQICALIGLVLAIALTWSLTVALGLSLWVTMVITLLFPATFWVLAMLTKIITGMETLVYYRHMLVFLGSAALLLKLLGQPLLPYLDITVLGIGVFIACGRLGCLLTGCCHGRPHSWGVRYGAAHVTLGFDNYLVGVRLFPTQLIESVAAASITLVGIGLLLVRQPPGLTLTWYLAAYATIRFGLEFWRGDRVRPYAWGISEAQWTSLVVLIGIAIAELARWLPLSWWQITALMGSIFALACSKLWHTKHWPLQPFQVAELAMVLKRLSEHPSPVVEVLETSDGVRISASMIKDGGQLFHYYAISRPVEPLTLAMVKSLATNIIYLRHSNSMYRIATGSSGIFHVLIAANS